MKFIYKNNLIIFEFNFNVNLNKHVMCPIRYVNYTYNILFNKMIIL